MDKDITMKDMMNYTKRILKDTNEFKKYLDLLKESLKHMEKKVDDYEESLLSEEEKIKIEEEVKKELEEEEKNKNN